MLLVVGMTGCRGGESPATSAGKPETVQTAREAAVELTEVSVGSLTLDELRKRFPIESFQPEDERRVPEITYWAMNAPATYAGVPVSKVVFQCVNGKFYSLQGWIPSDAVPAMRESLVERRGEPLLETDDWIEWQDSTTIASLKAKGLVRVTHVALSKEASRMHLKSFQ